ncbi:hypothetical protein EB796_020763 [Bugula neritina]|uniref:Uncharacterized protein n=1 Tax=Bugula neritina TaxID=10212 RepID=A0A7J7J441_BUGNE|nr:hypothetical protein EB796_020763 [Bugula neritina]
MKLLRLTAHIAIKKQKLCYCNHYHTNHARHCQTSIILQIVVCPGARWVAMEARALLMELSLTHSNTMQQISLPLPSRYTSCSSLMNKLKTALGLKKYLSLLL